MMAKSEPMEVDVKVAVTEDASTAGLPAAGEDSASAAPEAAESSTAPPAGTTDETAPGPHHRRKKDLEPQEPIEDVIHRRLTVIKEGDNVLLRLPSDTIKSVVVTQDG